MPFIQNTPESLLPRSDSKNPASTCRGLTSNGRPCRRALASPRSSPAGSPAGSPQRIPSDEAFCWQHKDQAQNGATAPPQGLQSHTIKERTSVDTLVDRLGFLEVSQNEEGKKRRKPGHEKPPGVQGAEANGSPQLSQRPDRPQHSSKPRPEERSNLGLFCCIIPIDPVGDEGNEAPRPAVHNSHGGRTSASMPKPTNAQPIPTHTSAPAPAQSNLSPGRSDRPSLGRDPSSRTAEFLSLIPQTTTPETTALLLAELAKPVSASDDEGFIYMFWLTPEALPSEPPSEAARSLLATPSRPEPGRRRTSDVLDSFASVTVSTRGIDSTDKKTILLKIGRAANVQRRLNQWTRQCGYNLSLIRYYPYHPSTSAGDEAPKTPRKLPYANKVERLIHIELKAKRANENENGGKCASCGREHREWFEVEADREGVRAVDEVIRRWVDWGEKLP